MPADMWRIALAPAATAHPQAAALAWPVTRQVPLSLVLAFPLVLASPLSLNAPPCSETELQAATRARELLAGLRRGPRDFLAGLRGPGDFVGEMEVLGERAAAAAVCLSLGSGGLQGSWCVRRCSSHAGTVLIIHWSGKTKYSSCRTRHCRLLTRRATGRAFLPMRPPRPPCLPARPCPHPPCHAAGGSQSRRVATVVAASGSVRAAVIPYTAAKAYLSRHPLVRTAVIFIMRFLSLWR